VLARLGLTVSSSPNMVAVEISISADNAFRKARVSLRMAVLVFVGSTRMATVTPMTAPIAVSSIRSISTPKENSPSRPYSNANIVVIQNVIRL
jgi:hypothetical protein